MGRGSLLDATISGLFRGEFSRGFLYGSRATPMAEIASDVYPRQLEARAPKNLTHVLGKGKRIRIVGANPPNSWIDSKRDLDQFVQSRFVLKCAEGAEITRAIERPEPVASLEHAGAASTKHVPRHVK